MGIDRFFSADSSNATPVHLVSLATYQDQLGSTLKSHASWLKASGFTAAAGKIQFLPAGDGSVGGVLCGHSLR